MPPYPEAARRHLARPTGAGDLAGASAVGESGSAACGDLVRVGLWIAGGRVTDARFSAFGCGALQAAASAACAALAGRPLSEAAMLSADALDRELGGLGPARGHGPEAVVDAVARAVEAHHSERLGHAGLPLAPERVAVAMSGGVDSAVAAMLLTRAGYEVVGVTMRLWHDPAAAAADRSCCSPETVQMARRTAHRLGIPHLTLDVAETFRRGVVEEFVAGYAAGRTPNPCVTCNGTVRFRVLAQAAAQVGAWGLATGHYARAVREPGGRVLIGRAADGAKDQSYMLAMVPGDLRERQMFPLGDMTKDRVRALAREAGLDAAAAVESQEVCFVGVGGHVPFLERAGVARRPGAIVDETGTVLGEHEGYWRFTVGQRRGIGVASDGPLYVLGTDPRRDRVVVGPRARLAVDRLVLDPARVHGGLEDGTLDVRVRYRGPVLRGRARASGQRIHVDLLDAADGVAPGQTAALYRDGRLVAAGTIVEAPRVGEHREE
ncbi:MAG: tRNA 2-thiouridine(34) synthase MnmA [Miltoncostaeaceae bacterium]